MAEVEIDGAEAPAAAAPPPEEPPKKCSSPKSMYEICLKAFVRNPEMRLIRFLPPSVIIDMFQTVSWPSSLYCDPGPVPASREVMNSWQQQEEPLLGYI